MRDYVIATVIAAIAGASAWTLRGSREIPRPATPPPAPRVAPAPAADLPRVVSVAQVDLPMQANSRRNLFAYVTPPPRAIPVPTPVPAPVVTMPPVVLPPPAPAAPPVPQFPYRYIGRFGPAHKNIAALVRDGDVVNARIGATLDGRFVLRAIHNDAIDVETSVGGNVHAIRVALQR